MLFNRGLRRRRGRLVWIVLVTLVFSVGCTTTPQIEWTESKPKPDWVTQVKKDNTYFYYRGSSVGAESLEEGKKVARQNAYSHIAEYPKADLKSEYTGVATDVDQDLKDVIKAKSDALIKKAEVVDSYYKAMTRVDGHSTFKRFDVHVLVRYPKNEATIELRRQQDEVDHKVQAAYDLYQKASNHLAQGEYHQSRKFSKEAVALLSQVKGAVPLEEGEVSNSRELEILLKSQEQEAIRNLRRVVVWVQEKSCDQVNKTSSLATHMKATLIQNGFTVLDKRMPHESGDASSFDAALKGGKTVLDALKKQGGQFLIVGKAKTAYSSTEINHYFFDAQGTISVFDTNSGDTILTIPIKSRGYHREQDKASCNALEEAGDATGEILVKEFLAREE